MSNKSETRSTKSETNSKFEYSNVQNQKNCFKVIQNERGPFCLEFLYFGHLILFRISIFGFRIYLLLALLHYPFSCPCVRPLIILAKRIQLLGK